MGLGVLSACSSSDPLSEMEDESLMEMGINSEMLHQKSPLLTTDDFYHGETTIEKTINGWNATVSYDGYMHIQFFNETSGSLSSIYAAPASIEELNGKIFTLSEGDELRCETIKDYEPLIWGVVMDYTRHFEYYTHWYKGVEVESDNLELYMYNTPEGKRAAWLGGKFTEVTVNPVPTISKQGAMKIFSVYSDEEIGDEWFCYEPTIRTYYVKQGNGYKQEQYLVYRVLGSYVYDEKGEIVRINFSSNFNSNEGVPLQHTAFIDAHTGRIITAF